MVKNYYLLLVKISASVLIALSFVLPTTAIHASGYKPYKLDMSRKAPDKPIRKSAIMAKVRAKWPGKVLHIASDRSGGDDCHVVKAIGDDGEFRIIRVACND